MKVLFVEPPPSTRWTPGDRTSTAGRRHPSLNFTGEQVYSYLNLQCAAVLRERGHRVAYLHCQTMGCGLEGFPRYLRETAPDLLVILLEHITFGVALELARVAREQAGARVVFVGPFVTALDGEVLARSGVDAVCRGEWDYAVAELAEAWEGGGDPCAVPGVTCRVDGETVRGPDRPPLEDLDALPLPAYDLLDLSRFYESVFKRFPAATMITSRGCPHRCVFCSFPQTIYSRRHRASSPERVLAEVGHLVRDHGVREIRFDDDCFEVDRGRVLRICELLEREKLDLIWSAQCRPGNVDPELARAMKRAGCHFVLYGVESGDDAVLKKMRKGTTVEAIRRGVRAAREAGIDVLNCIMLGFYWDTPETIRRTVEFAFELNAEFTQFSIPTPLPGTEYYELLRAEGCLASENWEEFDSFHRASVRLPHLPPGHLEEVMATIYRRYYLRPGYLWRMVRRGLRSWDNFSQSIRGARTLLRV
ncbi:MAG: hopanoid biosynthesis associated radical SAM protein HpnJ [Deferrisomatales bacterium]